MLVVICRTIRSRDLEIVTYATTSMKSKFRAYDALGMFDDHRTNSVLSWVGKETSECKVGEPSIESLEVSTAVGGFGQSSIDDLTCSLPIQVRIHHTVFTCALDPQPEAIKGVSLWMRIAYCTVKSGNTPQT